MTVLNIWSVWSSCPAADRILSPMGKFWSNIVLWQTALKTLLSHCLPFFGIGAFHFNLVKCKKLSSLTSKKLEKKTHATYTKMRPWWLTVNAWLVIHPNWRDNEGLVIYYLSRGAAILQGGHFWNLDWFWGTFSEVREHYLGVILKDFMKVVQSSNECQLKLNVTVIKSKHWP